MFIHVWHSKHIDTSEEILNLSPGEIYEDSLQINFSEYINYEDFTGEFKIKGFIHSDDSLTTELDFYLTPEAIEHNDIRLPKSYSLDACWVDKENRILNIYYSLPQSSGINLNLVDRSGKSIRELQSDLRNAGIHSIHWDCRDKENNKIENGVYGILFKSDDSKSCLWFNVD